MNNQLAERQGLCLWRHDLFRQQDPLRPLSQAQESHRRLRHPRTRCSVVLHQHQHQHQQVLAKPEKIARVDVLNLGFTEDHVAITVS